MPARISASGALAAGVGDPRGLELGQRAGRGDVREGPLPDLVEVGVAHRPGRVSESPPPAAAPASDALAHGLGQERRARGGHVERLGAGRLGDRHAHHLAAVGEALEGRAQAEPLGAQREDVRPGEIGLPGRHAAAGHGRHHGEAPARGEVGWRDVLEDGDREGRAHRRAHRARVEGVGRAGAEGEPVGAERGGGAQQRADVARVGHAREVDAHRGREAHVAEAAHGRLGQDRDDTRRCRQAARVAHQLRRHEVALGQALGRGDPRVVVLQRLGVEEHGDGADAARQRAVHEVLALGHEQTALAPHLLRLECPRELQRRVARRARQAEPARALPYVAAGALSRAARARAHSAAKAAGSCVASSARILRSSSTSASFRPWMS